jgi:hypothetical protein
MNCEPPERNRDALPGGTLSLSVPTESSRIRENLIHDTDGRLKP